MHVTNDIVHYELALEMSLTGINQSMRVKVRLRAENREQDRDRKISRGRKRKVKRKIYLATQNYEFYSLPRISVGRNE